MPDGEDKDDDSSGLSITFMVEEPFTKERLTQVLNILSYLESEGLTKEAAWHVIRDDGTVVPFAAKRYKGHGDKPTRPRDDIFA